MVAGTATTRTTVASISTAAANPKPMALNASSRLPVNAANTTTMIRAAEVTVRPVRSSPRVTACSFDPVRGHFAHPSHQKDLVVHGQAEQHGEQEQRHERLDEALGMEAEQVGAPAPLEQGDDHPVRGADRHQVHHNGFQGQDDRSQGHHEQQVGQRQHPADHPRQPRLDLVGQIQIAGALPAEQRVVDAGGGQEVGADPAHQVLPGRGLRGVCADHHQPGQRTVGTDQRRRVDARHGHAYRHGTWPSGWVAAPTCRRCGTPWPRPSTRYGCAGRSPMC
jgi:hypothetical protein